MPGNNSAFPTSTVSTLVVTSTSPTSVTIAGGVTVAGNFTVTGSITGGSISYASTTTGTLAVSTATGTTFTIASTQNSTSVGTGSLVAQGGASFAGNLYVGGTLFAGSVTYATTTTGSMTITTGTGTTLAVASVDDSTTTTNGSATFIGGVGVAKRLNAGSVKCFDSTQATSISTGCLQLAGGVGIAGNIFGGGVLTITNATPTTSIGTGCAVFSGGVGVAGKLFADTVNTVGKLNVGGFDLNLGTFDIDSRGDTDESRALVKIAGGKLYVNYANDFFGGTVVDSALNVIGITRCENVTASTSTTTGSLIVDGGAGVQGQLSSTTARVFSSTDSTALGNGSFIVDGGMSVQFNLSASSAHYYANYTSTSVSTGTLIVDGGMGVAGTVSATDAHIYATTSSTSTTTGALLVDGGLGIAGNLSGTTIHLYSTTASTSKTTGALLVDGGVGVAGKISFDTGRVYNTTDSTSTTAAPFVIDGGLAVAKKIWSDTINTFGSVDFGGYDLRLGRSNQNAVGVADGRGDTGESRAMVKFNDGPNTELVINYAADFGKVTIQSDLKVDGYVTAQNIWSETLDAGLLVSNKDLSVTGVTLGYPSGLLLYKNENVTHILYEATAQTTDTWISSNLGSNLWTFQVNLTRIGGVYNLTCLAKFSMETFRTIKFCVAFKSAIKLLSTNGSENVNFSLGMGTLQRANVFGETKKLLAINTLLSQKLDTDGKYIYRMTPVKEAIDSDNSDILSNVGYEIAGSYDNSHPDIYKIMYQGSLVLPILDNEFDFTPTKTNQTRLQAL